MAPAMKGMKVASKKTKATKGRKSGAALSKSGIAEALSTHTEVKKSDCMKVLGSLAEVGMSEVKKTGKFTIPGLVMVKTRQKPATKAGKREIFGKMVVVKARPARTVVKAFCLSALKKSV